MLTWKQLVQLVEERLKEQGVDDAFVDFFAIYGADGEPFLDLYVARNGPATLRAMAQPGKPPFRLVD